MCSTTNRKPTAITPSTKTTLLTTIVAVFSVNWKRIQPRKKSSRNTADVEFNTTDRELCVYTAYKNVISVIKYYN